MNHSSALVAAAAALTRRTIPADEQPTPRKGRGRAATSALSRNSLIKLRSTLSQALTWAQRRDLVTRNVAALAELPTGAITQRTGKSLSVEQARQLLAAAAGTELEAMWTLMLYLGLRPGEAAGLSWNDIDFANGTIHIWRARTTNTDGSVTIGSKVAETNAITNTVLSPYSGSASWVSRSCSQASMVAPVYLPGRGPPSGRGGAYFNC